MEMKINANQQRLGLDSFFCLLYMIIYTVPYFGYILGSGFQTVGIGLLAVWMFLAVLNGLPFRGRYFTVIGIYLVSFLIFALLDYGDARGTVAGYTAFWMFAVFFEYYYSKGKKETLRVMATVMLLSLCVTGITTLIASLVYPNISKLEYGDANAAFTASLNVGRYDYIYAAAVAVPMLLGCVKSAAKPSVKLLFTIIAFLFTVNVFFSGYTIAFIGVAVGICTYLIISLKSVFKIIAVILIAVLLLFIFSFGEYIVSLIGRYNEHLAGRLAEVLLNDRMGNTDLASRMGLLVMSLNTFIQNPIAGVGPYFHRGVLNGVGQHSQLADDLARYGIFSMILYIAFLRGYYRRYAAQCSGARKSGIISVLVAFTAMSVFNPTFILPNMGLVMLFLVPGLQYVGSANADVLQPRKTAEATVFPSPSAGDGKGEGLEKNEEQTGFFDPELPE